MYIKDHGYNNNQTLRLSIANGALFFTQLWANYDALKLARSIRAALNKK